MVMRSSGHRSPGQRFRPGRLTGQCDSPGVVTRFCSFWTRFIVASGKSIRHLGISRIFRIFTSSCLLAQILVIGCLVNFTYSVAVEASVLVAQALEKKLI